MLKQLKRMERNVRVLLHTAGSVGRLSLSLAYIHPYWHSSTEQLVIILLGPEQGIKLLGLLLTGSTGQHMASRNGLA